MTGKAIGILFSLISLIIPLGAQSNLFTNPKIITKADGLPNNDITEIEQDGKGFIWIGTLNGLCKYDGQELKVFEKGMNNWQLSNNTIYDIHYNEKRKELWVGTAEGLNVLADNRTEFKVYPIDPTNKNALGDKLIREIYDDRQNEIWLSTWTKGIARYDAENDQFERFYYENPDFNKYSVQEDANFNISSLNSILDIKQDVLNDSILWLGTLSGLLRFNKYSQKFDWFYHLKGDKNSQILFNTLRCIYPHPNGKIYLGGLERFGWFNPERQEFTELPIYNKTGQLPIEHDFVIKMEKKSEVEFWITYKTGLVTFNALTESVTESLFNQPKKQQFYAIEWVDKNKRIWAEGPEGLYVFNPLYQQANTYSIPTKDLKYQYITRKVVESKDKSTLFCCADFGEGLYVMDRKSKELKIIYPNKKWLNKDKEFECSDLLRLPNGKLLILSRNEILELSADESKIIPYKKQIDVDVPIFRRLFLDSQNNLWVTSQRAGLFRINAKDQSVSHFKKALNDPLHAAKFTWLEDMTEDKNGNIWIRLARSFAIYQPLSDSFLNFPDTAKNTFRYVTNFVEDFHGNMWAGSLRNGLGLTSIDNLKTGITKKFTKQDGLASDNILQVEKDKLGNIWALTDAGLSKIHPETFEIENFSWEYGIPVGNWLSSLATGEFVIGADKQELLGVFQPGAFSKNKELPQPYLSGFQVFEVPIPGMDSLLLQRKVTLQPDEDFFSMDFSAIAYSFPESVQFLYQLEDYDKGWILSSEKNFAYYSNLNEGSYLFRLKAANNEGVWNPEEYTLAIEVKVYFWKRQWFHILLVALGILLAYGFYRYRINQAVATEKVKSAYEKQMAEVKMSALRAQMNPHFLFNSLNSIERFIIKNDTKKASKYLNDFARLIRLILQNSRADSIPLSDEIKTLELYLKMESLRFKDKFKYQIIVDTSVQVDTINIPPMLLQPYIENAIWHGLMHKTDRANGLLTVHLEQQEDYLIGTVEDNGIGREAAQIIKHNNPKGNKKSVGMKITSDRIRMINDLNNADTSVKILDLKNEDGVGCGTRVVLKISI